MKIAWNDPRLQFCGRVDWENPEKPEFIFPATSLQFSFWGKEAHIVVRNRHNYWENSVGAIVDGVQKKWVLKEDGTTEITLLSEPLERKHKVLFFKRMDSSHELVLESLSFGEEGRLLDPPALPKRRMEVYGDSVSAGEVSEALEYVGKQDPQDNNGQYSNSWYSYAWMTARKLHAQIHDIAQGGIPLMDGTGWVEPPIYIGMESVWDKVHYYPRHDRVTNWDFSKYRPHLVLVAIGQNDANPYNFMEEDPDGEQAKKWKESYRKFLLNLREKYPKAVIVLATTILYHSAKWDEAIEEVCKSMQDDRIRHFLYTRNGTGTPGHIRIPEAEEMADELAEYIENLDISVWEEE